MPEDPPNRFGRRPGRGLRPWLLIPKVLAVALSLGGLAAVLAVWTGSEPGALPPSDPRRAWTLELISRLMTRLALPALFAALVLGLGLLLQHPRIFLRMRWMQLKLAALTCLIPTAHIYCASRLALLRPQAADQTPASSAVWQQFGWGVALALGGFAFVVLLGRLKPRLGQNWARDYPIPPQAR